MNVMEVAKKYAVPLCICALVLLLLSWRYTYSDEGGHVVTMPPVTEESLGPEQKADLDRLRQIQSNVMQQAGLDGQTPVNPGEIARQLAEEVNQSREAESGAVPAGGGGN